MDAWDFQALTDFGVWYHTSTHFADQRFDILGLSLANSNSAGIPLRRRRPRSSGFIRAGSASNDLNLVNFYGDAGLVYKGLLPGRSEDKIGIAVAHANIGKSARQLDADTALYEHFYYPIRSGEMMIEPCIRHSSRLVDAPTRFAIHHSAGRWGPQSGWQSQTKCVGGWPSLVTEFFSMSVPKTICECDDAIPTRSG